MTATFAMPAFADDPSPAQAQARAMLSKFYEPLFVATKVCPALKNEESATALSMLVLAKVAEAGEGGLDWVAVQGEIQKKAEASVEAFSKLQGTPTLTAFCASAQKILVTTPAAPAPTNPAKAGEIPADVKADIKRRCTAKWQNDSDAFSMTAYCVEKETNAWRKLQD